MRRPPINRLVHVCIAAMRALLLLVLFGWVTSTSAQEVTSEVIVDEEEAMPADMMMTEPGEFVEGIDSLCTACNWPTFGAYVKAGPTFQLGDGFFPKNNRVGYQIAFGAREPFLPNDRKFFLDFGGSYMSAFGEDRPRAVSGRVTRVDGGIIDNDSDKKILSEMVSLTLTDLSRASVHLALGWYFDVVDCETCRSRFAARFGGRLSHARGHFDEAPTQDFLDFIDNRRLTLEEVVAVKNEDISMTDTAPGIFAGIEMAIDRRLSRTARLSFLIDGEMSNDWINLRDYAKRGLPTASLLLGINLSR